MVRKVNDRPEGKRMRLKDGFGEGWEVKQLLYADKTVAGINKKGFPAYSE